jgi:hypothetical protein
MMATKRTAKTAPEKPKDIHCPIQMDPSAGDKTPAVVDWCFANHPEIAAAKYRGRKTHRDALERERLMKATANELPSPYNLKTVTKECKEEGYATEYGIAWIEGGKIQHKAHKQGLPVSGIPVSSFTRCIRIHKGAGWIIAERSNVASVLHNHNHVSDIQPAPRLARLLLTGWLKERHQELDLWIKNACENDIFLADLWREKSEEIKNGHLEKLMDDHKTHRHILLSLHMAFQSLDRVELKMDYGNRKDATIQSNEGDAFFITAMKSGYEAGRRLHQLKAELASMKAMRMASQTSSGKKPAERTKWLSDQLFQLEKQLGRKAKTREIIAHIEDKTDPETKEKIWFQAREGDDGKVIQWGEHEMMTERTFADKISHIRKSLK